MRGLTMLALVSAFGLVWACGSPKYRGAVPQTDHARLAVADSLSAASLVNRDSFVVCMSGYGATHAASTATPDNIADAGAAACAPYLGAVLFDARQSAGWRALAAHPSPGVMLELHDRTEASLAQIHDGLAEEGRQRAIRAVIEKRP